MKNIHILPTDKPSRLRIGDNRNFVFGLIQNSITSKNNFYTNQNLYITNSENIKEGDWYYTKRFGLGVYKNIGDSQIETTTNDYKKIILTTDSDLIKDGVQAIDDDFLEWFVKNPRCEEVELGLEHYFDKNIDKSPFFPLRYRIIIPTEEPKQEQMYSEEELKIWLVHRDLYLYNYYTTYIKSGIPLESVEDFIKEHHEYLMDRKQFKKK